jgi:glycine hydroxymethyltransferase
MVSKTTLAEYDEEIAQLIRLETERQEYGLEMIPSENFVSEAILEANGSVLTNKYAEGIPHKRYYGGCEVVDKVEDIAIQRAKDLFGAAFANVQPHSGAQANQAVFETFLVPGDTILGMRLDQGGHLTHGSPYNISGRHYKVVAYGVNEEDHLINYDELRNLALQSRPKLIIAGASAYSRRIDFKAFRKIADEIGAVLMADIAHYAGLVAAGEYPNPINECHVVTTTTHKTLRGPRSGLILSSNSELGTKINKAVFPGIQGGPHMHTIAAKAVCFKEAMSPEFKKYARQVITNARILAEELQSKGLSIITGGTDSHMFLLDLRSMNLTGKEVEKALDEIGVTVNKNTVPFDPKPPLVCSGIRVGTPAITTRGMKEQEMKTIASIIHNLLVHLKDASLDVSKQDLKHEVQAVSKKFPLYKHRLV